MKIKTLNQEVINQIAAGEVIVQPSSIVKELVENSIDAGANKINVSIKNGGKKEILVSDNGEGIAYNEIPLAFKRHATSKLSFLDDLESLETMGFRGEALSSIASVAKVKITTKNKEEDLGSQSFIENNEIINQTVIPFETGTEIVVTDLFESVPARYKFLKSDKREEQYIRDIVEKLALSHPEISFSYHNNDKEIFTTYGNGSLKDTAYIIFGPQFSKHLYTFETENAPMKIYGLIGDLDARRSYRDNQIFFINNRYVKSPILSRAYEEEWEGKLMKHQYPSGIIFVELPSYMLDVNVHPQKTEINILNKTLVTLLFRQCIREVLENLDLVPKFIEVNKTEIDEVEVVKNDEFYSATQENFDLSPQFHQDSPAKQPVQEEFINNNVSENTNVKVIETNYHRPRFSNCNIIGVLFNTYILVEDDDVVFIIDQHAAHEATLYEAYSKHFKGKETFDSQIILPQSVELTKKELEDYLNYKEKLDKFGFITEIDNNGITVKSVPVILNIQQPVDLIIPLLNYYSKQSLEKPEYGLEKVISMSCKAAVKGGNVLELEEIKELLRNLDKLENPYTCPHGRPVIQQRSKYELEKLFKRVV